MNSINSLITKSGFITTKFGRTHFLKTGKTANPSIVIIHGAGSNAHSVLNYFYKINKSHHLIALDIPGESEESDSTRLDKKNEDISSWIYECLKELHITRTIIAGYSLGGYYALKSIINHPELFTRALLIAPAGIINGSIRNGICKGLIPLISYKLFKKEKTLLNMYNALHTDYTKEQYDLFKYAITNSKNDHSLTPLCTADQLKRIRIPLEVIIAEKDVIYNTNKIATRLNNEIANITIYRLENEKHIMNIEKVSHIIATILK